jgi:hypothetical protein
LLLVLPASAVVALVASATFDLCLLLSCYLGFGGGFFFLFFLSSLTGYLFLVMIATSLVLGLVGGLRGSKSAW